MFAPTLIKFLVVVVPLISMTSISGYWGFVLSYDTYCWLRNSGAPPVVCFMGHQVGLNAPNWCIFCVYHFILTQPLHTTLGLGAEWWLVLSGKVGVGLLLHLFSLLYGRLSLEVIWSFLTSTQGTIKFSGVHGLLFKSLGGLLYFLWGFLIVMSLKEPLSMDWAVGVFLSFSVLYFNSVIFCYTLVGKPSYKSLVASGLANFMAFSGILGFISLLFVLT